MLAPWRTAGGEDKGFSRQSTCWPRNRPAQHAGMSRCGGTSTRGGFGQQESKGETCDVTTQDMSALCFVNINVKEKRKRIIPSAATEKVALAKLRSDGEIFPTWNILLIFKVSQPPVSPRAVLPCGQCDTTAYWLPDSTDRQTSPPHQGMSSPGVPSLDHGIIPDGSSLNAAVRTLKRTTTGAQNNGLIIREER